MFSCIGSKNRPHISKIPGTRSDPYLTHEYRKERREELNMVVCRMMGTTANLNLTDNG